jgi:hypothetical protein
VVCVDNSEFTRNGDYAPTRFQAQADAVNLLAGAKTQHHPENTVGVMTMAGKTPQVHAGFGGLGTWAEGLPLCPSLLAAAVCSCIQGSCSLPLPGWLPCWSAPRLPPHPPPARLRPATPAGAGHAHPRPGQGAERDAGDAH